MGILRVYLVINSMAVITDYFTLMQTWNQFFGESLVFLFRYEIEQLAGALIHRFQL